MKPFLLVLVVPLLFLAVNANFEFACETAIGCQHSIALWLRFLNRHMTKMNAMLAAETWKSLVQNESSLSNDGMSAVAVSYRTKWRHFACDNMPNMNFVTDEYQARQIYLFCKGSVPTEKEAVSLNKILNEMQSIYTETKICIPQSDDVEILNIEFQISNYLKQEQFKMNPNQFSISDAAIWKASGLEADKKYNRRVCLSGEPDLERIMMNSRDESVLKWCWLSWRQAIGPPIKDLFGEMVQLKNQAARRYGYADVGQEWREELEIKNLPKLFDQLYSETKELYELLHGIVNFFLKKHYKIVSKSDLIEAHITGNMWAQNWASILDIIIPIPDEMNPNKIIKKKNWTTFDMVKKAEDFYTSIGMPAMTGKFWKNSFFGYDNITQIKNSGRCHGSAANMFKPDDYRMIFCAELSMEDFYVIHHEMGHIQYYMAYDADLPAIFQEGTNSAFQESIGDSIMLGVMTPQHLHRLGLISDHQLFVRPEQKNRLNEMTFDDIILLYHALNKIPQIPYGYVLEKYRWDIFSGKITYDEYNKIFWKYTMKFQGIEPPNEILRNEVFFDASSKFHFADNTPYARYFLSSFLQMQIFKGMCQWNLFGKVDPKRPFPMPLHRCDIYGSKKAGKILREVMSKGRSIEWTEFLYVMTGEREISSSAFLEYFTPLKSLLSDIKNQYNISVGF